MPRLPLTAVVVVVSIALVGGAVGLLHYFASIQLMTRALHDLEVRKAEAARALVVENLRDEIKRIEGIAQALKTRPDLIKAAAGDAPGSARRTRLQRLFEPVYGALKIDILEIVDRDGTVLYRAQEPDRFGDRSNVRGVDEAMSGKDMLVSAKETKAGKLSVRALVPLETSRGPEAALVIGSWLDDAYLRDLIGEIGFPLALVAADGSVIASSSPFDASQVAGELAKAALRDKHSVHPLNNGDRTATTAYFSTTIVDEAYLWIVTLDSSAAYTGRGVGRVGELAVSLLLAVASVWVLWWLARTQTRKLALLRQETERVIQEEFGEKNRPHDGSEIDRLTSSVRLLRSRLLERAEQFRNMSAIAESASRAKGDFLAAVSHELRTPLNAIIGMVYLALRTNPEPAQRTHLDKIGGAANTLLELINHVLDYSKIESGQFDIEAIDVVLDKVIENAVDLIVGTAQARGVQVIVDVATDVPSRIVTDPVRLGQILANLLSNAAKFTPAGEIVLSVRPVPDADRGTALEFAVRDTGIGIPSDRQALLFKPFTQAAPHIFRLYGGTGLGLEICKRLTERMGGSIRLRSELGKGTTITFVLPCAAVVPGHERTAGLTGAKALVIESNETASGVLCGLLRDFGYETLAARDGAGATAALERARASGNTFELVLIDSNVDGAARVGAWIRQHSAGQSGGETKVVHLRNRIERRFEAEDGSRGHRSVFKPVTRASLGAALSADPAPAQGSRRGRRIDDKPLSGVRVLLAEDSELNREISARILEEAGAAVTSVGDGQKAVESALSDRFDIILMDVQMPRMDGVEATRAIRARLDLAHVPIVALTANALWGDRERFMHAGMNECCFKPVRPDRLIAEVRRWTRPLDEAAAGAPPSGDERPVPEMFAALGAAGFDVQRGFAFMGGDVERYRRALMQFVTETAGALRRAREALAGNDRARAMRMIHSLAGTAGVLGADELRKAALAAEATIRMATGDAYVALQRVEALLQHALHAVDRALRFDTPA